MKEEGQCLPPTHKTKGDGFVRKNEHTLVQLTDT